MAHLRFTLLAIAIAVGLFLALLVAYEGGRRVGRWRRERRGAEGAAATGKSDIAVFGLLSLLLGFAFSGAAGRFDNRREMVRQEVNAIRTTWLRVQTLPAERQPVIEDGLRRYLDALIAAYRATDGAEEAKFRTEAARIGYETWSHSVAAAVVDPAGEKARMLLLPSMNEMFDAVESEWLARRMHPPAIIYVLIGVMALIGAFYLGIGQSESPTRNWSFIVGVAGAVAIAMYVIIELEYPRLGVVRVDPFDRALVELRQTMNGS